MMQSPLTNVSGFTLSSSVSGVRVSQGRSGALTITVDPEGCWSAGSVALAISGLPAGVTASFSPASTTTNSALTLSASSSATPGTATLVVTGTSGGVSQTVAF